MKIGIVGAGAMGLLFGGKLAKSNDVTFVVKNQKTKKTLIEEGLAIEQAGKRERVKNIFAYRADEIREEQDVLFLFVKSYDTEKAIVDCLHMVGPDTIVITLQNGLGNLETINKYTSKKQIMAGTISTGAHRKKVNLVELNGKGNIVLGTLENSIVYNKLQEEVLEMLKKADIGNVTQTCNLESEIWKKAIINCCINPLTAIYDVKNGEIIETPQYWQQVVNIYKEAVAVAHKLKINLSNFSLENIYDVCVNTNNNISSMLSDISNNKRTEINYMNGAIVSEGDKIGIDTPYNKRVVMKIKTLESRYR